MRNNMSMSVIAGLTATKAALDITKIVMDKLNTATVDVHAVRASVQELLIHVVNAQIALGEARVEISDLRQHLDELQSAKSLAESVVSVHNLYWKKLDEGYLEGPFCPSCWHQPKQQLTRMRFIAEDDYYLPGQIGGATEKKRSFTCPLHSTDPKGYYLVTSQHFTYVREPWSAPPPI